MLDKIEAIISESINTQVLNTEQLSKYLIRAANCLVANLLGGHKVIICGSGRNYANAQILAGNLLHRYQIPRPSFPTILLSHDNAVGSHIIDDNDFANLYQKQLASVAVKGDIFITFLPFTNHAPILNAINYAQNAQLQVILFSNIDNLEIQLNANDIKLCAPTKHQARILENHLLNINILSELIDSLILTV